MIMHTPHINLTLIRADSPEEAYERSIEVGKQGEIIYENNDVETVKVVFRGLRSLNVIYEDLEHGSEILFEKLFGLSEEQVAGLVRHKSELSVFRPNTNTSNLT